MADRETLIGMAERCEKASGPDRELLEDAFDLCFPQVTNIWVTDSSGQWTPDYTVWQARKVAFYELLEAGGFLDAAMQLVPEGCAVDFRRFTDGRARAVVWRTVSHPEPVFEHHCERAATPARAMTAACLRALAAQGERG